MGVRNLDRIFKPHRVAVIGASRKPGTVGHNILHNLIAAEFPGTIYPVNPKYESTQGIEAYPDIASVPHQVDLAVIATPASTVPGVVKQCGEAGVLGLIVISAGFRETGTEGRQLEDAMRREAIQFEGMRILGPNCLGILVPERNLNASFAAVMPPPGRVAFISQSGALCTSVLDWALRERIGFSCFISIGNAFDVGVGDLIDYLSEDPGTESLILYVESITEARGFMSAARAFARNKPIVVYKAGRFAASAAAAASHTGAMAGVDSVYEAAFARAGMVRVFDVEDMFDCAELLSRNGAAKSPDSDGLVIVTNAGGPGVMATDALLASGGRLAKLSEETIALLDTALPAAWYHGNPIDLLGDAPPERFAQALDIVLDDADVDTALVVLTPQAMTDATATAFHVTKVVKERSNRKPVIAAWMGGDSVSKGINIFDQGGISTYSTQEEAVRAFSHLVSYARNRSVLYETPRSFPISFACGHNRLVEEGRRILAEGGEILSERDSKTLLELYQIPTAMPRVAVSEEGAVVEARNVGYPVAIKVLSPDISHKTDVGGVALNIASDDQLRSAFRQVVESAQGAKPDARIRGVVVEPMVTAADGIELILGVKKDAVFGPVLMLGAGGIAAEVLGDCSLELPPLNERLARRMIESLRIWPLLRGYRGRPAANIDKLIEVLLRLSCLVADHAAIGELDINPLLVTPHGVTALDARIVVDAHALQQPGRPYGHLAILPYPEQYVRQAALRDGRRIVLRPIRPEDEPLWIKMIAQCSP